MQISQANRLVVFAYLVVMLANIGSVLLFDHFRDAQRDAIDRQQAAALAADQLIEGSKFLTNSVRAFAATGDAAHEKAYWDEVRLHKNRDKGETTLRAMGLTPEEIGLIEEAKRNSDQLIALEDQAFKVGRAGARDRAIELVFGAAYQKALLSIYNPVERFRKRLNARMSAERAATEKNVQLAWHAALVLGLINAALVFGILGWFYRRRVIQPLVAMNEQMQHLAAGRPVQDLSFAADDSELGELARSFAAYRVTLGQIEASQWVKTNQGRILAELQQAKDHVALAKRFLAEVAPLIGAGLGAYYVHEPEARRLRLLTGYAFRQRKRHEPAFAYGEGLVGQCALERISITLTRPPDDYLHIGSSLGVAPPQVIVVLPVLHHAHLRGVVEFATFGAFDDNARALLDDLLPMLGMSMEILERRLEALQPQATANSTGMQSV